MIRPVPEETVVVQVLPDRGELNLVFAQADVFQRDPDRFLFGIRVVLFRKSAKASARNHQGSYHSKQLFTADYFICTSICG